MRVGLAQSRQAVSGGCLWKQAWRQPSESFEQSISYLGRVYIYRMIYAKLAAAAALHLAANLSCISYNFYFVFPHL